MKRLLARRAPRFTRRRLPPVRFEIDHRAIGPGYGMPTPASIAAIPEVERLISVPGEVTYSAKALAALRGIAQGRPRETILLWQTLVERATAARGGRRDGAPAGVRAVLRGGDRVLRARRGRRAAPRRHFSAAVHELVEVGARPGDHLLGAGSS